MKLIPVDCIPKKKRGYHDLQDYIEAFVHSDDKIVKVEIADHEYKSSSSCHSSMATAVKRSGYAVKVVQRENVIYLKKV